MSAFQSNALFQQLNDKQAEVRRQALAEMLERPEWGAGLTVLVVRMIGDRDEAVRQRATQYLERCATPQADDSAELAKLLQHTDDGEVEYWAATMIGRLGPAAAQCSGALANLLLQSSCLAARERAAWALAKIGPAGHAALGALRQIGAADPPRLRRLAEAAIAAIAQRAA